MAAPQQPTGTELPVVPPGPISRNTRHMLVKFMQGNPGIFPSSNPIWTLKAEKAPAGSQKRGGISSSIKPILPPPPPLILERLSTPGETVARGVPEGGASVANNGTGPSGPGASGSSYYFFVRSGKVITAYPVDLIYSFKPPPRRGTLSLEDAEARMKHERDAAAAMGPMSLAPKSLRDAAQLMADEAKERGGGGRGKTLSAEQALAALFGEDGNGDGEGGPLGIAGPGRRAPARPGGTRGGRGGRGGRGRALKGTDGRDIDKDELAEDIYEGLGGEGGGDLRPEKPEPAEDWDVEAEVADDDLSQGTGESEDVDDDPGTRIKLGLEGGSDGEGEAGAEEEDDEATKKLKKKIKQEEDREEGDEEIEEEASPEAEGGAEAAMDDGDEDLDLDEMANKQLDGATGPPVEVTVTIVQASVTVALTGTKRKADGGPSSAPGPSSGALAAALAGVNAGADAKRARPSVSPPASGGPAAPPVIKREQVPTAATAPSAGVPSSAEIRAALLAVGGSMTMADMKSKFAAKAKGKDQLEQLKRNMMAVVRMTKDPDGTQRAHLK